MVDRENIIAITKDEALELLNSWDHSDTNVSLELCNNLNALFSTIIGSILYIVFFPFIKIENFIRQKLSKD